MPPVTGSSSGDWTLSIPNYWTTSPPNIDEDDRSPEVTLVVVILTCILLSPCVLTGVVTNASCLLQIKTASPLTSIPPGLDHTIAALGALLCGLSAPLHGYVSYRHWKLPKRLVHHNVAVEFHAISFSFLLHAAVFATTEATVLNQRSMGYLQPRLRAFMLVGLPWVFGAAMAGFRAMVIYLGPGGNPSHDSGTSMVLAMQELFTILIGLLVQVVVCIRKICSKKKLERQIGATYQHKISHVSHCTEQGEMPRLQENTCLANVASRKRISVCDGQSLVSKNVRYSVTSSIASCASNVDGTPFEPLDIKAKLRPRLGSDLIDELDESGDGILLPGVVSSSDGCAGNDMTPKINHFENEESVNVGLVIHHWQRPGLSTLPTENEAMSSSSMHPSRTCSINSVTTSNKIYTISEDIQQEATTQMVHEPACVLADPNTAYHSSNSSAEALDVPYTGKYRSGSMTSSLESTNYLTPSVYTRSSGESMSSGSRSHLRLSRNSRFSCGGRSMRSMGSVSDILPPLRNNQSAAYAVGMSRSNMVDAYTTTDELEDILDQTISEQEMLDPRVRPGVSFSTQQRSGVDKAESIFHLSGTSMQRIPKAWGSDAGGHTNKPLRASHPFFQNNTMSPTAAEKITRWRTSASSAFTADEDNYGMDEATFFDLCFAGGASTSQRSTLASRPSYSLDNMRSVSQLGTDYPASDEQLAMLQQGARVPIEIRVIRPSGSSSTGHFIGSQFLKRKRTVFSALTEAVDEVDVVLSDQAAAAAAAFPESGIKDNVKIEEHEKFRTTKMSRASQASGSVITTKKTSTTRWRHQSAGFSKRQDVANLASLHWRVVLASTFSILLAPALVSVGAAAVAATSDQIWLLTLIPLRLVSYFWAALIGYCYVVRLRVLQSESLQKCENSLRRV